MAMRAQTKTQLGIVLNHTPSFPATPTEADRRAARIDDGLNVRWYMDPIFPGAYPQDAMDYVGADAPGIEAGDLERIGQPLDFLGINFYTRGLFGADGKTVKGPGKLGFTDMGWEVVPEVFAQHVVRLAREYNPPPMSITGNGMANADRVVDGHVPDKERIAYLSAHRQALSVAMSQGADVRGYVYWRLLDHFEWNSGYDKRFGLIHADYETLARLPKDSTHWYRELIAQQQARR